MIVVPVEVPAVRLSIANTSLLVEWTELPPKKARGHITGYQILRRMHTGNQPTTDQPVVATVTNVLQHVIDGMALMVLSCLVCIQMYTVISLCTAADLTVALLACLPYLKKPTQPHFFKNSRSGSIWHLRGASAVNIIESC